MTSTSRAERGGRPREQRLDQSILDAALDILSEEGVSGLTYAAVAKRAGTTRPAVYRRYETVTELAIDAIAGMAQATAPTPTGDHLADLTAELSSFRRSITAANGLDLAAAMLADQTHDDIKEAYRRSIVVPRRQRIQAILEAANADGTISATPTERAILATMCTGSWYGFAVAGTTPPRDWAKRTARLVLAAGRPGSPDSAS